jgi:8-oxo-dGTP diphosphatase
MINEFYKNLPKKRMGAGMLFFNEKEELLIVKPVYKDHWTLVGGVVDENESPLQACIREVKEEIGIELQNAKFLCVDYVATREEKDENLQFIFYGGILNKNQISNIKLADGEIGEFRFAKVEETKSLLSEKFRKRLPKLLEAIKNNTAFYLENEEFVV